MSLSLDQLTEPIIHMFICQSNVKFRNVMCIANKNEEENYFKRILSPAFLHSQFYYILWLLPIEVFIHGPCSH